MASTIFGNIKNLGRVAQIGNVLAKHGFLSFVDAIGLRTVLSREQQKKAEELDKESNTADPSKRLFSEKGEADLAKRLRLVVEELGPAFIKLAQMVSSREDILPEAFQNELAHLQNDVKSLKYEKIHEILLAEWGEDVLKSFKRIEPVALAAGSIGQVHAAETIDEQKVVIKIRRPGIEDKINVDLDIMQILAGFAEKYYPELRRFQPRSLIRDLKIALKSELDFLKEAGHLAKVTQNFQDQKDIVFPKVHWKYSTKAVLVTDFLEGFTFTDLAQESLPQEDRDRLFETGFRAFLKMVFIDGLYHGDLHAGNLMVVPNKRLALIDFGLTVRISRNCRESLAGLLTSVLDEDYESMVRYFLELSDPVDTFPTKNFEDDLATELGPYLGITNGPMPAGHILWKMAAVAAQHGTLLPRSVVLIFKTLASFEGLGKKINPHYDVMHLLVESSQELFKDLYSKDYWEKQAKIILRDLSFLARRSPRRLHEMMATIADGRLRVNLNQPDVRMAGERLERVMITLSWSLICGSIFIGSAWMTTTHDLFVRDVPINTLGIFGLFLALIIANFLAWSVFKNRKQK